VDRLADELAACRGRSLRETLDTVWRRIDAFRAGGPPDDDATLLLLDALGADGRSEGTVRC
jgi:hypothetical protein